MLTPIDISHHSGVPDSFDFLCIFDHAFQRAAFVGVLYYDPGRARLLALSWCKETLRIWHEYPCLEFMPRVLTHVYL